MSLKRKLIFLHQLHHLQEIKYLYIHTFFTCRQILLFTHINLRTKKQPQHWHISPKTDAFKGTCLNIEK